VKPIDSDIEDLLEDFVIEDQQTSDRVLETALVADIGELMEHLGRVVDKIGRGGQLHEPIVRALVVQALGRAKGVIANADKLLGASSPRIQIPLRAEPPPFKLR
jgi:hypothetical protein